MTSVRVAGAGLVGLAVGRALARRGVGLLKDFCAEHGLRYGEIGKVVVARTDLERERLRDIRARAERNGVPAPLAGTVGHGCVHKVQRAGGPCPEPWSFLGGR